MMSELREHGYTMSPGTLYPILHSLAEGGYQRCEEEVVKDKVRKYHRTTPLGDNVLRDPEVKIRELCDEVPEDEPSAHLATGLRNLRLRSPDQPFCWIPAMSQLAFLSPAFLRTCQISSNGSGFAAPSSRMSP